MRQVRQERSGWRDEELSRRHRDWGWDSPMVDIDFLVAEYDHFITVALIEYKHENAPEQVVSHPSYRVLINLGDRAKLPVYVVRYAADFSWYKIVPLNEIAKRQLVGYGLQDFRPIVDEESYVSFLYALRGRKAQNG